MREGVCVHFNVGGHSSSEQKGGDRGSGQCASGDHRRGPVY